MNYEALYQPPVNYFLALALLLVAILALGFSIRGFYQAYHRSGDNDCALWLVRGLRGLVISLTAGAWAASFFWAKGWLFIIGLVIIGQEMFEGAVLSLILRSGQDIGKGKNL